jgi:hypothetical protein
MFQVIPVQTERVPQIGYQLINLGSHWELRTPTYVFKGSWQSVRDHAVNVLEFSESELITGRNEMEKHFNNAAEYGFLKCFMFTFELEEIWKIDA